MNPLRWHLLSNLDTLEARDLFDRTYALYESSFPEPLEREPKDVWAQALTGGQHSYRLEFFIVCDRTTVAGGAAFEYYPLCRCGFVTFVFIHPAFRGRHLARALLARVEARLVETSGRELRYVFAEVADPMRVATLGLSSAIDPQTRVKILGRLGAQAVPVPYVQPALTPGGQPAEHLRLLVLYPKNATTVPRHIVADFLTEMYRSLISDAAEVRALVDRVVEECPDDVMLLPLS